MLEPGTYCDMFCATKEQKTSFSYRIFTGIKFIWPSF